MSPLKLATLIVIVTGSLVTGQNQAPSPQLLVCRKA